MKVEEEIYFEKTRAFSFIPLCQSYGFYLQNKKPQTYTFYLDDEKHPTIACFGCLYHKLGIKLFVIKSICYNNPTDKAMQVLLEEIRNDYPIVEIKDEHSYSALLERNFWLAGYRRPMGQFGTRLTVIVPLSEPLSYNRMWRRNIKAASENDGIDMKAISNPTEDDINQIARLFEENSKQKNLTYCYTASDLKNWLSDDKFQLFVVTIDGKIAAARILMIHQNQAIDVATANGDKARAIKGITQYLVDGIFNYLKQQGIETFDFSGMPIGRKGAEGVMEFKNGVESGILTQYNGDWLATKKNYQRKLVYIINKYIRRAYEY